MHVDQLRAKAITISIEYSTAHALLGYTCSSVFAHAHNVAGGVAPAPLKCMYINQ